MRFSQIRIRLDRTQRRFLRAFPRFRRWWLDIPVEERIAVGELRVCNGKLRIKFDCTFETFDRLSQTFGGTAGRVVTTGGVKLASFLVLSRLRFGSRY